MDSVKTAIGRAKDILAERIAEDAGYRTWVREITMNEGRIASEVRGEEDPESVYEKYFHHEEPAKSCPGHRVLALNRGEKEKILTVKVEAPEEKILQYLEAHVITGKDPVTSPVLKEVVKDSYGPPYGSGHRAGDPERCHRKGQKTERSRCLKRL